MTTSDAVPPPLNPRETDHSARGAIGNGRVLAYLAGPNVATMYGPEYSSPALAELEWVQPITEQWNEFVSVDRSWCFTMAETTLSVFAEETEPALTYRWTGAGAEAVLKIDPTAESPTADGQRWFELPDESGHIAEVPPGRPIFVYPSPRSRYVALMGDGIASRHDPAEPRLLTIELRADSGWFSIIAADSFEEAENAANRMGRETIDSREDHATQARSARVAAIDATTALRPEMRAMGRQAADQLLAQQSVTGGFIAGDRYPLSYLRDQYGTSVGLLSLGLIESVRRNILYRFDKWRRYGDLANAEAMSDDQIRHVHENDEVEQTGYFVMLVMDYVDRSADLELLREVAPLLEWCLTRQSAHLADGALPFNGDETYIAGSVLPRWAIEDGSLEATILYAESIRRLRSYRTIPVILGFPWELFDHDLEQMGHEFARNFVHDGRLVTNSLRRRTTNREPAYRTGVCEGCGRFPLSLRRNESVRFVCYQCTSKRLESRPEVEFSISSTTLIGALFSSPFITPELLGTATDSAFNRWQAVGYLPSDSSSTFSVGYDEGLLLRALIPGDRDRANRVAGALTKRLDRYGTWAEYYDENGPRGSRCRPWETGMNIAALIQHSRAAPDDGASPLRITQPEEKEIHRGRRTA